MFSTHLFHLNNIILQKHHALLVPTIKNILLWPLTNPGNYTATSSMLKYLTDSTNPNVEPCDAIAQAVNSTELSLCKRMQCCIVVHYNKRHYPLLLLVTGKSIKYITVRTKRDCQPSWLQNVTDLVKYSILDIRWGPYKGGNLPKVRSRYCPHEILPWPSEVEFSQCTTGYEIWNNLNFPMLNPHWQLCKYGPHLYLHVFIPVCVIHLKTNYSPFKHNEIKRTSSRIIP